MEADTDKRRRVGLYRIVVASPGDVAQERKLLARVVDDLNHGLAGHLGIRLELWRWETDSFPGFHPQGPQGQIDRAMDIEHCDVVIGIFWKRFGTPTTDAKSGTEHELRRAIESYNKESKPHVMVYFSQKLSPPARDFAD